MPCAFGDPAVLESICYRTRANRLINESNTTGGLKKNSTGCEKTDPFCLDSLFVPSLAGCDTMG